MQAAAPITISRDPEIPRVGTPEYALSFRSFQGEARVVGRAVPFDPSSQAGAEGARALAECMAKLDAMRRLEDGWNSYSAPRPSGRAIDLAGSFVQTMWQSGYPPRRVVPSAAGGVAVSSRAGDRHVCVEFFNDGRAFALFSDDVGDPDSREVRPGRDGFRGLIREMKAYLDE